MTCKYCIHYEACHDMYYEEHATRHFDPEKHNAEKECGYFKDRSRFVELPCKHGDTLFRIINGKIEKGVATAFFYGSEFHIVDCRFPKISTGIPFHRFGETVFLSREEAEQALKLKERENNAN